MHLALTMGTNNPLSRASGKVLEYLELTGKKTFKELLAEFWEKVRRPEMEEILEYLQMTDAIMMREETDELNNTAMYYIAKKKL